MNEEIGSLRQQLSNSKAETERLWKLLRELEWQPNSIPSGPGLVCLACERQKSLGHAGHCHLRRALEECDPNHGKVELWPEVKRG